MDWNWTEQPSVGPVINLLSQRKPLKSDIDFKNMWNTRSYLAEDTLVQDHTVYGRITSWSVWTHRYTMWRKLSVLNVTAGRTHIGQCVLKVDRHCLLHCTEGHRFKHECLYMYVCGRVLAANAPGCTAAEGLLYKPWSLVFPTCTAMCLHQRP